MIHRLPAIAVLLLICLLPPASACCQSTDDLSNDPELADLFDVSEEPQAAGIADPLYYLNRGFFHFNDALYTYLLNPVTYIYRGAVPPPIRTGFSNVYDNLKAPVRMVNCLLQGKTERFGVELGRFMVNSTVGILGFFNPADRESRLAPPPEEDMGQTFGVWGVGNGIYLYIPIIGPSTLRDSVGRAGDSFVDPVYYITPELSPFLRAAERLNWLSFHLGEYEELKAGALDPYEAFKDIYLQYRRKAVSE